MKLNLNFQRCGGLKKDLFCGGRMVLFWNYTLYVLTNEDIEDRIFCFTMVILQTISDNGK